MSGRDLLHIIFGGLPLDMSLGGYILMVASLIMAVSPFFSGACVTKDFFISDLDMPGFFCCGYDCRPGIV